MAKVVEPVKVLNIDEVPYAVDGMSPEVQEMVGTFNGWNQEEANILDELQKIRSAKNDLSRRIILQVREEKEKAAEEAATSTGDGTVSDDEATDPVAPAE